MTTMRRTSEMRHRRSNRGPGTQAGTAKTEDKNENNQKISMRLLSTQEFYSDRFYGLPVGCGLGVLVGYGYRILAAS